MRSTSLLVLFAAVGGCSTAPAPTPVEPLEVRGRFSVDYSGVIETELTEQIVPTSESLDVRAADSGEAQVRIEARIVRMPGAEARRVLGIETGSVLAGSSAWGGGYLDRAAMHAAVDALVESGVAEEIGAPSLVSAVGKGAKVGIARQLSMVRGYRITGSGARFIGDPIVDQVEVGLALDALATDLDADGSMQLDLEFRVVDMLGDLRRLSGSFDGAAEVAVQVPLACRQRIACTTRVAADEAVFATGIHVPGSDDVLVLFADARTGAAVAHGERGSD